MKTYKRELAVALLIWLGYVVEVKNDTIIEILVWPIFTFATAAFGLDQYSKLQQNGGLKPTDRRGSKRSCQHPDREDEQPNDWHDK